MEQSQTEDHLVTRLLRDTSEGDASAREKLVEHVYAQLRRIAQNRLARERPDHTLQPTELVHEVFPTVQACRQSPTRKRQCCQVA